MAVTDRRQRKPAPSGEIIPGPASPDYVAPEFEKPKATMTEAVIKSMEGLKKIEDGEAPPPQSKSQEKRIAAQKKPDRRKEKPKVFSGDHLKINLDENVPIPTIRSHRRKWPFYRMKVGDSFFVEGKRHGGMTKLAQGQGAEITTRVVEENGVLGMRVWRIK